MTKDMIDDEAGAINAREGIMAVPVAPQFLYLLPADALCLVIPEAQHSFGTHHQEQAAHPERTREQSPQQHDDQQDWEEYQPLVRVHTLHNESSDEPRSNERVQQVRGQDGGPVHGQRRSPSIAFMLISQFTCTRKCMPATKLSEMDTSLKCRFSRISPM